MQFLSARPRLTAAMLLGSLCLNMLLAAYVGTQWLERLRLPLVAASPTRLMTVVAARLPAADADLLWKVFRSRENEFASAQADYQKALAEAGKLLAQEPLDAGALRGAVTDARNKRVRVGDLAIDVFLEAFPSMSPDGRRGLVGALRRQ